MKCYKCKGNLQESVELIIHSGRTIPQKVLKCFKCGTAITHINDYEQTRKQLHKSFIERIKAFIFGGRTDFIELTKGKVL